MTVASNEKLVELINLENEYFKLEDITAKETARCKLRSNLVKGFVKNAEMVDEVIEKLSQEIANLKIENAKKEEIKKQEHEKQLAENARLGYANLIGSEKQIKWAESLRKDFIKKVEKLVEESKNDPDLQMLDLYCNTKDVENISIELIENTLKNILSSKIEATYYIDNRYTKAIDVLIKEIKNN